MKYQISNIKGFTLVELLVAIGLFTAVAVVIISVLFTSFRASKKSEVIVLVKQSGNTALSQMVNNIRYAKSLNDPAVCIPTAEQATVEQATITITGLDDGKTVYSCPTDVSETISSNSAALVDVNAVSVDSCSFICSQTTTSDPPTITIQFTLNATYSTNFAETSSSIPFQTAVTLRNYNR